jgi:cytochrome P450
MKNVINETLRLCPSVPADFRAAEKDDLLPNGCPVKVDAKERKEREEKEM